MTAAIATLNPAAQVALASCEQRIERGLKTFIDVGQALAEIRDSRLYKGTHATFEDYCQQRWGFSRQRAQQFTAAAELATTIVDTGLPSPTNEGQARALAAVPDEDRADVWREVVESGSKPTAAAIRKAAEARAPKTPEPTADPSAAQVGSGSISAPDVPPSAPGADPAPAAGPAADSPAPRQEPDLKAKIRADLAEIGAEGTTQAAIGLGFPRGVLAGDLGAAIRELVDAGEVEMVGRSEHGGAPLWALTELVDDAPTKPDVPKPPPGSPAAWTAEEREANQREIDRKRLIADGQKAARNLVMSVQAEIGTVVSAIDLGEKDLINAEMIAKLRRAVDLLESRLEASK